MYKIDLQALIQQVQLDDSQEAFGKLYRDCLASLVQFAYSYVNDIAIAEEIVNDVFVKLWINRQKIEPIKNVNVYLYKAVKNGAINQIRNLKTQQRHLQNFEVFHGNFYINLTPEQIYWGREMKQAIENEVNKLPPKCKLVFQMVKEDGLTIQEVSEILSISYKTVFTQLTIALKRLEKVLVPANRTSI